MRRQSGVERLTATRTSGESAKLRCLEDRSEVDAGTREWGGQHPVAAHLIPLRPTCHFKC